MKKIILTISMSFLALFVSIWNWQNLDELFYDVDTSSTPSASLTWVLHDDVIDEPTGFIQQLLQIFWLERFASWTTPETGETLWATNFVGFLLNLALSFAALIALIVLISGFAMMLFASEEEWIAKAKKYIFGSAVAIFVLWISWLIVSGIFYIYDAVRL